eukprot:contig_40032_g9229
MTGRYEMKQIVLVLAMALALALPHPAAAQDDAAKAAIQDVIAHQFDAFRAEDVDEAWRYASPMIHGMFRNPGIRTDG